MACMDMYWKKFHLYFLQRLEAALKQVEQEKHQALQQVEAQRCMTPKAPAMPQEKENQNTALRTQN